MNTITVKCPATVSNLCCGFDILGMALNEPYDRLTLTVREQPGILITHTDAYNLSTNPVENVAGIALQAMINELKIEHGFEITIAKNIKPGSGIGSSAASAAGVIAAANILLGIGLSRQEQIRFAMEGEKVASGALHADNVAPCMYGGIVLIRDTALLDIIELTFPTMFVTILHPQIEIKTSYAREILPAKILLKDAVKQWANVAGLITGLLQCDYPLISRSLEDVIIEPVRAKLIPGYDLVKEICIEAGVLGGGISGSGPSVFMLSENEKIANDAEVVMKDIYIKLGIDFKTYVTTINKNGIEPVIN